MRSFIESELVLATHNEGKVQEISALLEPYVADFYSAGDLNLPEPEETGADFIDNAVLKAKAAALGSGKPALADDSGLSVTALGGAPGIYSARWAVDEATGARDFTKAMARVHKELGDTQDRSAAFICALALAWPDGHVEVFEGRVEGQIIWPARGAHGFGYDPIFVPEGYDLTFAEMEAEEKQAISHRARAFEKLVKACF